MKKPRRKASKKIEPRFDECLTCAHYRYANVDPKCRGCESGENFEEEIDELEPDDDVNFRGSDDDEEG